MHTIPPLTPDATKERLAMTFFDNFGVRGLYVCETTSLALFSTGRVTGVAVMVGAQTAVASAIYEGYNMPHATVTAAASGDTIDEYLGRILSEGGFRPQGEAEDECVREIKEALGYVALHFDTECRKRPPERRGAAEGHDTFRLPDGSKVAVGDTRFRAPEVLFRPQLVGIDDLDKPALHEAVHRCIQASDLDIRKDLYADIVVGGGTAKLPGLRERLRKEVQALAPGGMRVAIEEHNPGSEWAGGSMLACKLDEDRTAKGTQWVTREEYEESGPAVLGRKCF